MTTHIATAIKILNMLKFPPEYQSLRIAKENSLIDKEGIKRGPILGADNTNETVYEACFGVNETAF
jgi:hypothetical protein